MPPIGIIISVWDTIEIDGKSTEQRNYIDKISMMNIRSGYSVFAVLEMYTEFVLVPSNACDSYLGRNSWVAFFTNRRKRALFTKCIYCVDGWLCEFLLFYYQQRPSFPITNSDLFQCIQLIFIARFFLTHTHTHYQSFQILSQFSTATFSILLCEIHWFISQKNNNLMFDRLLA